MLVDGLCPGVIEGDPVVRLGADKVNGHSAGIAQEVAAGSRETADADGVAAHRMNDHREGNERLDHEPAVKPDVGGTRQREGYLRRRTGVGETASVLALADGVVRGPCENADTVQEGRSQGVVGTANFEGRVGAAAAAFDGRISRTDCITAPRDHLCRVHRSEMAGGSNQPSGLQGTAGRSELKVYGTARHRPGSLPCVKDGIDPVAVSSQFFSGAHLQSSQGSQSSRPVRFRPDAIIGRLGCEAHRPSMDEIGRAHV